MAIPNSLKWEIDRIPRNRKITHGPGLSGFAVDGIEPGAAVFPNTSPPRPAMIRQALLAILGGHPAALVVSLALAAVFALAACGTSDPARESAPTRAAEATAIPTAQQPTPTAVQPTSTPAEPAPAAAAPSGIAVDSAKADATLIQLVDALDEPEFYCVDVPGFGASLNLRSALTAHTCKPGADDEIFAANQLGPGNLFMPAYDLCMEADGTDTLAQLYLRACSDSAMQRFDLDSYGSLILSGAGLCMAVSPGDGEPTGGPSHVRRDLLLLDCGAAEPARSRWVFPGRSPA